MAIISLPTGGGYVDAVPRFLHFANKLHPNLGGEDQQINRPGSRFALDVVLPPKLYDTIGDTGAMKWISKLNQAMAGEALFQFPQPRLTIPAPGVPRVNGGAQSGQSLTVDGFNANWPYRDGQFFSILHQGNHYLHHFTDDSVLSGAGSGTFPIFPMLRVEPDDNSLIYTAPPFIQGELVGEQKEWTIDRFGKVGLAFSIKEKR